MAKAKKKGRVVRLTPDLVRLVTESQRPGETIPAVMRRLIGSEEEIRYVLPSDIHESVEDARGVAVIRAVERRTTAIEKPLKIQVKK